MNKQECLDGAFTQILNLSVLLAIVETVFGVNWIFGGGKVTGIGGDSVKEMPFDTIVVLSCLIVGLLLFIVFWCLNLLVLKALSKFMNYLQMFVNYPNLCYLPVTEEELDELGLVTVSDYVYQLATIMNATKKERKKDSIYTYNGVCGYIIPNYLREGIDLMFRNKYKVTFDSETGIVDEFYRYLRFVTSKKDAEGLCKAFLTEI